MASPMCQTYRRPGSARRAQARRRTDAVRPAITVKIGVYLTDDVARRFRIALKRRGMTKSGMVNEALAHFLDPPPVREPGEEVLKSLRALGKRIRRLQREMEVVSEMLALFVRYFLTITPPLLENERRAAEALGRERYSIFVRQIAKRITSDKGLVLDVMRTIVMTHPHLVAAAVADVQAQGADSGMVEEIIEKIAETYGYRFAQPTANGAMPPDASQPLEATSHG